MSDSQKEEQARSAQFAELRAAKTAEIENGGKMLEDKKDELATAASAHAQAREDLAKENGVLSEEQRFLKNLKETPRLGATCCGISGGFWSSLHSRPRWANLHNTESHIGSSSGIILAGLATLAD